MFARPSEDRVGVVGAVRDEGRAFRRVGHERGPHRRLAPPAGATVWRMGRPSASTGAWILIVWPPRERPMQPWSLPPFSCCGPMTVDPDAGAVDHRDVAVTGLRGSLRNVTSRPGGAPAHEAEVGAVRAVPLGHVRASWTRNLPRMPLIARRLRWCAFPGQVRGVARFVSVLVMPPLDSRPDSRRPRSASFRPRPSAARGRCGSPPGAARRREAPSRSRRRAGGCTRTSGCAGAAR